MFFIAIGAWLAGIAVSLVNHNRKLTLTILAIGLVVLALHFTVGLGVLTMVMIALLAIIIWIANKAGHGVRRWLPMK